MKKKEIDIKKATDNLRAYARAQVAKREKMQFRIEAADIERIYVIATKMRQPVGTMIRQWVLERLEMEESGTRKRRRMSEDLLPTVALRQMDKRIRALETWKTEARRSE